jgi:DNA-binding transcriptional MerR regulator
VPKLSEYVKVAKTAEILGFSQGKVRIWAADGMIPNYRIPANGDRLFKREDLEGFQQLIEYPTIPSHRRATP